MHSDELSSHSQSETWDILGGHLQIVNFEEKKLVDILEIPKTTLKD